MADSVTQEEIDLIATAVDMRLAPHFDRVDTRLQEVDVTITSLATLMDRPPITPNVANPGLK